ARMAERLATGLRINKSSDDAAGMAVSERLKNQVRGLTMAGRNAQDGVSLIQTAEGAMAETHNILGRLRELAVQAASDTLNATDRANLQTEANQLVSEIDRIAASTQFNGTLLLNKNSTVSLHDGGDGLQLQIGANATTSANQLTMTLAAMRSQDLGDVSTLNAAHAISATAKTIGVGTATGVKYNGVVNTAFDVRDAINAAAGNITATVKNGKLRLESTAAVGTVFANDGGNLQSTLFATNATVNTATSTTVLEDLGVTASGTMTITATSAAITGATTLANLGVSGGDTLVLGLQKAAGTGGAASTTKLADLGVTAGGTLAIGFKDAAATETRSVAVTYATTDTISALATRIDTAISEAAALTASGNTGTEGLAVTVGGSASPHLAIALTGNSTAYTAGTFTINVGRGGTVLTDLADSNSGAGALRTKLNLAAITGASSGTTAASSATVNTAAFTESVTYTVGAETDLTAFAAGLQTAIQGAGKLGTSDAYDVSAATAAINGSNQLAIDVSPSSNGVTIATIAGSTSNKLRTLFGLGAAPASAMATGTMTVAAQTETATVSYTAADTLASVATKIQTAVSGIGRVGTSLIASSAGTAASFNAGTSAIDITGVDTDTTLTFSSGALRTALNLAAPDTSVAGTTSSSAAIVQDKYRLQSISLSGVTSISSGTGGILDIGTQTAASAAIATVDSAINLVSSARASVGAMQTRLESATRSIAIASENAAAANSRIADADVAQSMSDLVRAQILQQAGISVLAQANQAPSLVLQLLK
ncbi:MAG: hypothetical protein KGS10_18270, partial [Chloroflexi bacterium]|nr:hypothetical protein [Chloroflexota bacterium]